jgi:hypothetical protein
MGLLSTWVARIGLTAGVLATAACGGPPCDEDPLGCGEGDSEFAIDPSCELTGPLEVALGERDPTFAPYQELQEPTLHEGAQGGHHLCLALRVAEPALDYPLLKVVLDADFDDPNRCADEPACDPWVNTGHRELVLGPELPVNGDSVEEGDFILVISLWPEELVRRIRLEVTDPCGRVGTAEHRLAAVVGG